jgi:DNA polymerase III epsilon subunit-like protein
MAWHRELPIGFDLETTGTDPHGARIVTGAVIEAEAGEPVGRRTFRPRAHGASQVSRVAPVSGALR